MCCGRLTSPLALHAAIWSGAGTALTAIVAAYVRGYVCADFVCCCCIVVWYKVLLYQIIYA